MQSHPLKLPGKWRTIPIASHSSWIKDLKKYGKMSVSTIFHRDGEIILKTFIPGSVSVQIFSFAMAFTQGSSPSCSSPRLALEFFVNHRKNYTGPRGGVVASRPGNTRADCAHGAELPAAGLSPPTWNGEQPAVEKCGGHGRTCHVAGDFRR